MNLVESIKRSRATRDPIPMDAIQEIGAVNSSDVPESSRIRQRRWQPLADRVFSAWQQHRWYAVRLDKGYDPDVIRSGLKEEFKRLHKRLDWRQSKNEDDSITLYLSVKGE